MIREAQGTDIEAGNFQRDAEVGAQKRVANYEGVVGEAAIRFGVRDKKWSIFQNCEAAEGAIAGGFTGRDTLSHWRSLSTNET